MFAEIKKKDDEFAFFFVFSAPAWLFLLTGNIGRVRERRTVVWEGKKPGSMAPGFL